MSKDGVEFSLNRKPSKLMYLCEIVNILQNNLIETKDEVSNLKEQLEYK